MAEPVVTPTMIARSRSVAESRWSPSGQLVGWLDGFDGRYDLQIAPSDVGRPPLVVTAEAPVTPVGGYGGGGWCWASDAEVLVAGADGRLVVVGADGRGPLRVLARDGQAMAPAVAPGGRLVAFACERDDACDVAVVALDGSSWPVRVSRADFAWDPAWSPDGKWLTWHEWDFPAMPWEASRIMIAAVGPDGSVGEPRAVAGSGGSRQSRSVDGRVAVAQPRWSPDGTRLTYVRDAGEATNVVIARADGARSAALREERHDHASPSWGPGMRAFAWSPDSAAIAYTRNEDGFGQLVRAGVRGSSTVPVAKAFHDGLDWSAGGILAVRSGAVTPPQVVVTDPASGARRVLARGAVAGFEECGLVEPTPVRWRSGRETVHGMLYEPASRGGGARRRAAPPPMMAYVHGGPTDQTVAQWSPRLAFWVSRGWAVLAVNYRGSSGYGRAYREALDGKWGVHDVADVAAGIRHAGREGWCDPQRVAVMGGSAGGFTVLLVCAHHGDLVAAGVSVFGVADLFTLAETTHRFESRYLDSLVGELPRYHDRSRERSPITHASSISVPMLVLQGRDDKVVPLAQSDAMVAAMRSAGADVEYQVYDGEGHGFRRLTNVVDEYERTERFLNRHVLGVVS